METNVTPRNGPAQPSEFDTLLFDLGNVGVEEAAARLRAMPEPTAGQVLLHLNPSRARELLLVLPDDLRTSILSSAPPGYANLWTQPTTYPEDSIGQLMRPPVGVLPASTPLAEAIEELRRLSAQEMVTYLYAVDADGRLAGVVVLRDLFLRQVGGTLADVMIAPPFYLGTDMTLLEAMRATVSRHYPVYPVCDADRRIVGLVRGHALFEKQAVMINAQQATMVGLRATESLTTHWQQSLRFRHPWLQFSLLAGLLPAVVVAFFQGTIARLVILAVFAPLVAHQARNSGAQTMAITLRGLNSGEWQDGAKWRIMLRESALAALNGAVIGLLAGILMAIMARNSGRDLFGVVSVMVISMAVSCALGAVFGVLTPLGLRVLRADPAHASSIVFSAFVTTGSQIVFLGLASWLLH